VFGPGRDVVMSTAILTPQAAAAEQMKTLVLDGLTSPESKRAYGRALDGFLAWHQQQDPRPGFDKATVQRYKADLETRGLAPSTINLSLAAIRKLALEAADNKDMDREVAASIQRVNGVRSAGTRTGSWLTVEQAEKLLSIPNTRRPKGKRDRALLAVLLGCGLRRQEAAALTMGHIQQREGRWVIVDLVGKGNRVRTVPMPSWCKVAIDAWTTAAGITEAFVFRSLNKGGRVTGDRMTAQAIFEAVRFYGDKVGGEDLAPHDLRRTFAKLAHKGHAALEQIQLSLGHASVQTTERYLGVRQDLADAPCDHLGLKLEPEVAT